MRYLTLFQRGEHCRPNLSNRTKTIFNPMTDELVRALYYRLVEN